MEGVVGSSLDHYTPPPLIKGGFPISGTQKYFSKNHPGPLSFCQRWLLYNCYKVQSEHLENRLRGYGQWAAPDRGQGRPPDWTSRPPALAPGTSRPLTRGFPRAGWALIAGSGNRCLPCRRDSEEGHGTFRTRVRRLPERKIEKGSVISRSRGNPEFFPSWQGGSSGPPASFHLYPVFASPTGAPGIPRDLRLAGAKTPPDNFS
jgi:hypothetical protein